MWLLLACADPGAVRPAPTDYQLPGPHAVGYTTITLEDADRPLAVSVWFPTHDPPETAPITTLYAAPEPATTVGALLDASPEGCARRETTARHEAKVLPGKSPLVLMSHCLACSRQSMAQVAEQLVSWGFVVAAPDHYGATLFDSLEGTELEIDDDALLARVDDLGRVLDAALAQALPVEVDPLRIGLLGHSFGAVTVGRLLQDRPEPAAAVFVAAPPGNPLVGDVDVTRLDAPLLFYAMAEDHSIGVAGNLLIDQNLAAAPGPAWRVELEDGGHWSPSDLVGLTEGLMPGCGDATREEGGAPFSYPDPAQSRMISGGVATAFFMFYLNDIEGADRWLSGQSSPLQVEAP